MKRSIQIFLGDKKKSLGELRYDHQGQRENAAFAYSNEWLENDERFPIDPALP